MNSIKIIINIIIIFVLAGEGFSQKTFSFQFDNKDREYILYLPVNLKNDAPLVFVFHGYSGNAKGTMKSFGMNKLADKHGFAVCYPQGLIDHDGNHFWQVGYKFHKNINVNDVDFICALAESLQQKYKLSKNNTFITGFSNGGDLCNLLLCQTSGIFRAAAPIISCIMKETYDSCTNSKPVPVFLLNGTKDNITYWNGDMNDSQGYGAYLSTEKMLSFRIKQNNATLFSCDTIVNPEKSDTTSVIIQKYINSNSKNQVWMYKVVNGGHGYPDYINLSQEIWNFFNHFIN